MDFKLSEEHEMIRKMVRDFAEKEVAPTAAERDEEERFDPELFEKMAKLGLTGIPWPEPTSWATLARKGGEGDLRPPQPCGRSGVMPSASMPSSRRSPASGVPRSVFTAPSPAPSRSRAKRTASAHSSGSMSPRPT